MSVSAVTAESVRQIEPLRGIPARMVAEAQGHTWEGIAGTSAISEHIETVEMLDQRGDRLMAEHLKLLARAAATARREGAHQTYAMLCELIASAQLLDEVDTHEDAHRREIGGQASGVRESLRFASGIQGALLGHKDAVCGRIKTGSDAVTYLSCQQPAGHGSYGGVCVFEAVATADASLP